MLGKHSFGRWLVAVRPWSFPASAMPVAVTLAYLFFCGEHIDWINGLWALLNVVIFHAAGNTWSDWFDFRRGVDASDTFGAKTLTDGEFTPGEILFLSLSLLCVASVAGIGLFLRTGWPLMWIGLIGAACVIAYPQLKYRAAGDAAILVAYALLPTIGTSYAVTGAVMWNVLWIAVPIGSITVAILHANNTRDIATDSRAGISTLAMTLGRRTSAWLYCFEVLFPFLWIVVCMAVSIFPLWSAITFATLFLAVSAARTMLSSGAAEDTAGIRSLDERTAQLQLIFSLLLAISFVVAGLLR